MSTAVSGKLAFTGNLLFVIAALFVVIGVISLRDDRAARNWPTVEGRIESSQVKRDEVQRVDTAGQRETRVRFRAEVRYSYRVDGVPFQGTRVSALDAHSARAETAEAIAARYPSGSRVQVHYDPASPGEALLEIREGASAHAPLGLAGLLALIAVVLRLADRLRPPTPAAMDSDPG